MEAVINKLELKKLINKYYLKIELTDLNGHIHIINKPFLSDPINFRKQVFGIMSACGSYDLMKLATDKPVPKKVIGYYYGNGLQILENENEEWFIYDKKRKEYICNKVNKNKKKAFQTLIDDITFEKGNIQNITSQSGIFQLLFNGNFGTTFYTTNQIYYGFGYPLNIGNEEDIENCKKSAQSFTSFIVSLMKFYGIDDLLKFGGNVEKLPVVQVNMNSNNEIDLITNPITGIGLSITNEYDVINTFEFKKTK